MLDDDDLVIEIFSRAPSLFATDRGFHCEDTVRRIEALGVRTPTVPKPGYRSAEQIERERQRQFRRGRAWRAAGDAVIGHLKSDFGMRRNRYRGVGGTRRTIRWAGIVHNLKGIAPKGRPP